MRQHLLSSRMCENATVLQNEGGFCDLAIRPFLSPLRRLQLHLPVDARKMASLLQNRLQKSQKRVRRCCSLALMVSLIPAMY